MEGTERAGVAWAWGEGIRVKSSACRVREWCLGCGAPEPGAQGRVVQPTPPPIVASADLHGVSPPTVDDLKFPTWHC